MTAVKVLPLSKIELNPAAQTRFRIDKATVSEYADDMRAGAWNAEDSPAIVYAEDGGERYICSRGFHRITAAIKAGWSEYPCEVREGGLREAVFDALGSNARHGLRRTAKDKRKAITICLTDPEWGKRSARWVADACRVSHPTVQNVYTDLVTSGAIDRRDTVIGKDGKEQSVSKAESGGKNYHLSEAADSTVKNGQLNEGPESGVKNGHLSDATGPKTAKPRKKPAKQSLTDEQKQAAAQVRADSNRQQMRAQNAKDFRESLKTLRSTFVLTPSEAAKHYVRPGDVDDLRGAYEYLGEVLQALKADAA